MASVRSMGVPMMVVLVLGLGTSPALAVEATSLPSATASEQVSSDPSSSPFSSSSSSVAPSEPLSTFSPDSCLLVGPALPECLPEYNLQAAQDGHRLLLVLIPGLALCLGFLACLVMLQLARR